MNIIQSSSSVSPGRRIQVSLVALSCAVVLAFAGAVGANNLEREARVSEPAPEAAGFNVSQAADPAIAVIYQAAESEGLVPDESQGGFRSPANLRERLQAERGEFSNALR